MTEADKEVENINDNPQPPHMPDFGLGVAQIVITAATPMIEEAEKPFPPPSSPPEEAPAEEPEESSSEVPPDYGAVCEENTEKSVPADEAEDDQPTDSAPFPISSSTGSEEDTYTGPSTAENSQSHPENQKTVVTPAVTTTVTATNVISTTVVNPEPARETAIPDELEPHQLARLQDLKESDA